MVPLLLAAYLRRLRPRLVRCAALMLWPMARPESGGQQVRGQAKEGHEAVPAAQHAGMELMHLCIVWRFTFLLGL